MMRLIIPLREASLFFKGTYNVNYAGIAAYSVLIIIPELIIYALFQNSIVEGMTAGAVKG